MTLTAQQIANTTADAFDVAHRYFASGAPYDALTLAHFQSQPPVNWIVTGDTIIPPAGWTEITDQVIWAGEFTEEWREDRQTWQASLQGITFAPSLLSIRYAIACFVRYEQGTWDSGWQLEWVGAIIQYGRREGYAAGQAWQVTIGGTDTQIARYDGPRLVTGKIDPTDGAALEVSGTLANPADEAGNGEFVGTTVTVAANNMIDGRINTVWISQNAPTLVPGNAPEVTKLNEIFFKSVTGYDASAVWWIEIMNSTGGDFDMDHLRSHLVAYTSAGKISHILIPKLTLPAGRCLIICRNRAQAEAYAGSFGAAHAVIETDVTGSDELTAVHDDDGYVHLHSSGVYCQFDLNQTGGWVFWLHGDGFVDAVKYGADITGPGGNDQGQWTGAPVSLTGLDYGESLGRSPAGTDTDTAADWQTVIPTAGDYRDTNASSEWVKAELMAHTSTLTAAITISATTIRFNEGVLGWPFYGQGVIEGDVFDYTGLAGDTLTGVTNLGANHAIGALAYPYANGQAQSGWYLADVTVSRRKGASSIKRLRAWFSRNANCRSYDQASYVVDYQAPFPLILNGLDQLGEPTPKPSATSDITIVAGKPGRWVRTILLAIDAMWDAGRAKINEISATLYETNPGILTDGMFDLVTGATTAGCLAAYLLDQYTWLNAFYPPAYPYLEPADFDDHTGDGWGVIGKVATAVAPVPEVVADLARTHGCVVRYTPTGQVTWERNPWWPSGVALENPPYPVYTFDETTVREEIRQNQAYSTLTGVAIVATDTEGNVLARHVYPTAATGSQVHELTDITVADEKTAADLAFYTYLKLAAETRAELTVRGIGEWCAPRQRVKLTIAGVDQGQWIIERVVRRWSWQDDQRHFETALELRSYMGMP